ncbi:hypothetical protein TIFTF001_041615 [Ficus carica]|uniref:Uncharacterized protein n=1 Tax=Ficus carica TaxID=3494 RepID=A0AA87ZFC5_FICCA|nr:hypothetical protein TIFTF001_041615 [Ficus carica]
MSTEEELKDPWVTWLYLKNPKVVPQLPPKTSVPRPSTDTNSEWREFQKEIRGQVDSMNKKLEDLKKGQKKSTKLLRRVLKLLSDNINEKGQGKAHTAYHVSSRQKINVQTDESDALKTTSNDLSTGSQDDVFIDSDIGVVADMGVQAAMEFLTADKVIVSQEDVEEEKNKIPKKKRARLSRLGQRRSGPMTEVGSPSHAPSKLIYVLPPGLADEPLKEKLEEFREWIKKGLLKRTLPGKKIKQFLELVQRKVTTVDEFFSAKVGALWRVYQKSPDTFDWGSCDSILRIILGVCVRSGSS